MKRILVCLICIAMLFGITACGGKSGSGTAGMNDGVFTFATEDMEGNAFTSEDVKDAKLIMVNLWEPWCGPCVGEMPDLEKVYEEYMDDGFVILGVFSETSMDEDAKAVLEEAGITYPILRASEEFGLFQTGYVPTTVFLNGAGELVSDAPIIGSQSYEDWERTVKNLLEEQG